MSETVSPRLIVSTSVTDLRLGRGTVFFGSVLFLSLMLVRLLREFDIGPQTSFNDYLQCPRHLLHLADQLSVGRLGRGLPGRVIAHAQTVRLILLTDYSVAVGVPHVAISRMAARDGSDSMPSSFGAGDPPVAVVVVES